MVPEVRYRGCTIEGYHHQFNMYIVRYIFGGLWGGGGGHMPISSIHLVYSVNQITLLIRLRGGWGVGIRPMHECTPF